MADRKWKEGKQQPSMLLGSAVPGSSLVPFYFLWAILCPQAVYPLIPENPKMDCTKIPEGRTIIE